MTRRYNLKRRAERQVETRQRIIDAAIALHQTKGIAATSVNDVAERAGVGRVTVYRHFADEMALARACSGQYYATHPFPDVDAWGTIADPLQRLRTGLRETYAYHRVTRPMMTSVLADARDHPVVEPYHAHWRHAARMLAGAWRASGPTLRLRQAAISLALSFDTWRLLAVEHGLDDDEAVAVAVRLACDWT